MTNQKLISPKEASSMMETKYGVRCSNQTLLKMIHGSEIESVKVGKRYYTTREAIHRLCTDGIDEEERAAGVPVSGRWSELHSSVQVVVNQMIYILASNGGRA